MEQIDTEKTVSLKFEIHSHQKYAVMALKLTCLLEDIRFHISKQLKIDFYGRRLVYKYEGEVIQEDIPIGSKQQENKKFVDAILRAEPKAQIIIQVNVIEEGA